jgi:hypothetical protein
MPSLKERASARSVRYQAQVALTRAERATDQTTETGVVVLDTNGCDPFRVAAIAVALSDPSGLTMTSLKAPLQLNKSLFSVRDGAMVLGRAVLAVAGELAGRGDAGPLHGDLPVDAAVAAIRAHVPGSEHWRVQDFAGAAGMGFRTPAARLGDLVVYCGIHANVATRGVKIVQHVDFMPAAAADGATPSNDPAGIGSGKSFEAELGLVALPPPRNDLERALRAGDSVGTMRTSDSVGIVDALIAPDQELLHRVRTRGWAVFPGSDETRRLAEECLADCERYFNHCLFDRVGVDRHLSFADLADPAWRIINGRKEAERIAGNPNFCNVATLKRDADGNERMVHNGTAQGGNGLCCVSDGMGVATNMRLSPSQMALQCCADVFAVMSALYNTDRLVWIPERFRVKASDDSWDGKVKLSRGSTMPPHVDVVVGGA